MSKIGSVSSLKTNSISWPFFSEVVRLKLRVGGLFWQPFSHIQSISVLACHWRPSPPCHSHRYLAYYTWTSCPSLSPLQSTSSRSQINHSDAQLGLRRRSMHKTLTVSSLLLPNKVQTPHISVPDPYSSASAIALSPVAHPYVPCATAAPGQEGIRWPLCTFTPPYFHESYLSLAPWLLPVIEGLSPSLLPPRRLPLSPAPIDFPDP